MISFMLTLNKCIIKAIKQLRCGEFNEIRINYMWFFLPMRRYNMVAKRAIFLEWWQFLANNFLSFLKEIDVVRYSLPNLLSIESLTYLKIMKWNNFSYYYIYLLCTIYLNVSLSKFCVDYSNMLLRWNKPILNLFKYSGRVKLNWNTFFWQIKNVVKIKIIFNFCFFSQHIIPHILHFVDEWWRIIFEWMFWTLYILSLHLHFKQNYFV